MPKPYLPQEILDHIVGFLHDEPEALKACCLASKSWVPRTRKHLFAKIEFKSAKDFELWTKAFPDPSNSPSHHTHTMFVRCNQLIVAANAREVDLIQTFSHVARLRLFWLSMDNSLRPTTDDLKKISLAPFHKFSSTLKSLRLQFLLLPYPQIFNLVHSSPLLEDFALFGLSPSSSDGGDIPGQQAAIPLSSPAFTGCLELHIRRGMGNPARRLLDMPGGLHFRKLALSWFQEDDLQWITEFMTRCTDTLECIDLDCNPPCDSGPVSVDLSEATKLQATVFRPQSPAVAWVTAALQTINTKHLDLQQISIHAPSRFTLIHPDANVKETIGGEISEQWLTLDRFLIQFLESRSIRLKVVCRTPERGNRNTRYCIGCLLPEVTKRGFIDLV